MQVVEFLAQARDFLLEVHQIAQRDVQRARLRHGGNGLFRHGGAAFNNRRFACACQTLEILSGVRKRPRPAIRREKHQVRALARGNVHFRAQVADGADDLHHALHLRFLVREVQLRLHFRPRFEHQEALTARQELVHLLGQERHERVQQLQQLQQPFQHIEQHALHGFLCHRVVAI